MKCDKSNISARSEQGIVGILLGAILTRASERSVQRPYPRVGLPACLAPSVFILSCGKKSELFDLILRASAVYR